MKKCLFLFFFIFSLFANAENISVNGINYRIYEGSGKATVIAGQYKGDVVIPDSFVYNSHTYFVDFIQGKATSMVGQMEYGDGAFLNCKELSSITLPKTTITIGRGAFEGCDNLEDVYIYAPSFEYYMGVGWFFENPQNVTLHIRERYKAFYDHVSIDGGNCREVKYIEGIDYRLMYIVNGDSYKNVWFEVGEATVIESDPQKEGYSFSGWSEIPETMPDHDVTVTGTFTVNKYKLIYNVDGEEYQSYDVEYGSQITPEDYPEKDGYKFSGWEGLPETMPAKDVIVTGTFIKNRFRLTYMVDGKEYKYYDIDVATTITPENEPASKKGMTFSGWSEIPKTMPAHDVEVIGTFSWLKKTIDNVVYQVTDTISNYCTVTGNDHASGEIKISPAVDFDYNYTVTAITDKAFYGKKDITTVEIPAKVARIGERAFANIDKLTDVTIWAEEMPTTDRTAFENSYIEDYVTLHVPGSAFKKYKETAPWKNFKEIVAIPGTEVVQTYKLTYTVDGEAYKTVEVKEGDAITPEEEPTKEGYTFSGWKDLPETMPGEDVTVAGTFTINKYKLTYLVDDAEYKVYEVEYGSAINPEDNPTKEGYTFSGWSGIPGTMPASDVTVTGYFTINKYTITYIIDGEVYKTVEVEYGAEIIPEDAPEKDGYEFSGWSWIPSKMPAEDVTVTGSFIQTSFDVDGMTYKVNGDEAVLVHADVQGDVVINAIVIISGRTYNVYVIGENAFEGNNNITSLTISDGIRTIMDNAFNGCSGVRFLKIGKDVRNIRSKSFAGIGTAYGMRNRAGEEPLTIECYAESVPEAFGNSFDGAPIKSAILKVNDDLVKSYKTTSPWNSFGTIIGFNEAKETGIGCVMADESGAMIFSIDGRRLDKPQKGMNIIWKSQGEMRKVMVK